MPFFVEGIVYDMQCVFRKQLDEQVFKFYKGAIKFEVENTEPQKDIDLCVKVLRPSGQHVNISPESQQETILIYHFVPSETGPHEFVVENRGYPLMDSPRTVKISSIATTMKTTHSSIPRHKQYEDFC